MKIARGVEVPPALLATVRIIVDGQALLVAPLRSDDVRLELVAGGGYPGMDPELDAPLRVVA